MVNKESIQWIPIGNPRHKGRDPEHRKKWLEEYYKRPEYKKSRKESYDKWILKLRIEVLTHYGNGKCECINCGFSDMRALQLDHIHGDGAEDRHNGLGGIQLYKKLRRDNYPEGYQTLCANCNWIKRHENKEHC